MGLPVLMLDRKGVQAGTQASKRKLWTIRWNNKTTTSSGLRHVASTRNLNACWESESVKSVASDGYAEKPHSHDHAAMYGIQYSAKPWISETPYDRGAKHNETKMWQVALKSILHCRVSPLNVSTHSVQWHELSRHSERNTHSNMQWPNYTTTNAQPKTIQNDACMQGWKRASIKVVASPRIRRL